MRCTVDQLITALGAQAIVAPAASDALIEGVSWDSRTFPAHTAYLALKGERTDGHRFVADVLDAGCPCAVVTDEPDLASIEAARRAGAALVRVDDAQRALWSLAAWWRDRIDATVVAITGSVGKTSTKELVSAVLSAGGRVCATPGNRNNELGVPATLLSVQPEDRFAVVEMGMRGLGQIADLCAFVRPDWGVVTKVGDSHIELLGSREAIAQAKAELFGALDPARGRAFLNMADDSAPVLDRFGGLSARAVPVVRFDGSAEAAERRRAWLADQGAAAAQLPYVWAEDIVLDPDGRARFTVRAAGFAGPSAASCTLSVGGLHSVSNAVSAAAVGLAAGIGLEACVAALAGVRPQRGRQMSLRAPGGALVVDDAYNAGPDSMASSLRWFASLAVPGRRIAVLGDMGELGPFAPEAHERVGGLAAASSLDLLVCVGPLSRRIAVGARAAGMPDEAVVCASAWDDALAALPVPLGPDDAVLVKASRFMGLERIVEGLVG
ncbi:UDP-N-acetylmuramoyl-tripeptide--D-alanyl-D-alanine ligase [Eggerthellaceae bacterium zg-1084]|uniref:UDP-N-acetylmuramoyl-tripeptide--D-alanyl-D- alanine ligase n=1 Tax=Berryella wangjianweii TaxID=2734634 RepID=UPI0015548CB5|nr:UDP-N-acetylmuramoyl-tripeptide--D-alanyl-D-alanine ligase [Berryella wangjianweii]NPD31451.1 UDP-N-acetylmuramoyl-tripeptide--D-alanyl-D-alanine ligase [Berryella wangjianweii]